MLSYHGRPSLKKEAVERARVHAQQDMLASGTYGDNEEGVFKGCSVGCDARDITGKAYNGNTHEVTSEHYGFPLWMERLRDAIFEGLPDSDRRGFHLALKQAIPVGADLENVRHHLTARRMDRLLAQMAGQTESYSESVKKSLLLVKSCALAEITGVSCDWEAAKSAALLAAERADSAAKSAWLAESAVAKSAAESEAKSVAESEAKSVARSAQWAARPAESAAKSAAKSAAYSAAARSAEWAAWSAESAAESEAKSAARSAEWAAWSAESAARSAALLAAEWADSAAWLAWQTCRDDLLETLADFSAN